MSLPSPANEDQPRHRPSTSAADDLQTSSDSEQDADIDQSLREVEQSLLLLKARYAQITLDRQHQQELQQQKSQIEFQLQHDRAPASQSELKRELKQIKKQIEDLEVSRESQLFSWNGLKEVFWQALRFGGLGVVVGWMLKSCAG